MDNVEDVYPLSPTQHGILFHALVAPESGIYIEQWVFTLEGALDTDVFATCWRTITARHAVLRTAFFWNGLDEPLQVVQKEVPVSLSRHDWRDVPHSDQQARLAELLAADKRDTFMFERAPLFHLTLIRLTQNRYTFVWTHHHILLDGWSVMAIINEVFALYQARVQQTEPILPVRRPYREYIAWLREQNIPAAETFWRAYLDGFDAPTPLGVDYPWAAANRAPGRTDATDVLDADHAVSAAHKPDASSNQVTYAERSCRLTADATARLRSLARREQVTLNTLLQGAWAILLSRYSGEREVVFGATVAGRPPDLAGVEQMVGLFINTLPVRVRVEPQAALLGWLRALQWQQADARQYDYSPLVQIQGWSAVPRGQPLFDSLFVFENYPATSGAAHNSPLRLVEMRVEERTNYPLTIMIVPGAELGIQVTFDTSRFAADAIERLVGHVQTMLEGMVARPESRISQLPLLTDAERNQLLVTWNATQTDEPEATGACVHQLFERQVRRTPDAIALAWQGERITFAELDARASLLASSLRSAGVGPDVRVGLYMERSPALVVGILAVLKASGAYVPLDASYPVDRLRFVLDDAQVALLLTQQRMKSRLPATHSTHSLGARDMFPVLCLDETGALEASGTLNESTPHETDTLPSVPVLGDHLAYVLYTSGSTGQPKGVMVTHRGLANYLLWSMKAYRVEEGAGAPVHSAIGFDLTVTGLFTPLLSGRCVTLLPENEQGTPIDGLLSTATSQTPDSHQSPEPGADACSLIKLTPSHLALLRHVLPPEQAAHWTRAFIIGGEALTEADLSFWRIHAPHTRLINEYGPTETVVGCCVYDATDAPPSGVPPTGVPGPIAARRPALGMTVPIGRPIANTQLYILDDQLQAVPIGICGELYIGGAGLARGYLNRPDLTAERFVPHPFSGSGERLYRTGDLARYLPDGTIEYLGRRDSQVKLRGYRIELGEIEAVLRRHPAVGECAAQVRVDTPGDARLVAYLAPPKHSGASAARSPKATPDDLRVFAETWLPPYMIPATFVWLDAIPLTANGKLDRPALPDPTFATTLLGAPSAPRTPMEELLCSLWADVLHIPAVDVHETFFALGGHSLLAIQVIGRIREAVGVELPLRALFEAPTVAQLGERLEAQLRAGDAASGESGEPAIVPLVQSAQDVIPLSFAQERLWFLDQFEPESRAYHIPLALRLSGDLSAQAMARALNEIVRRHDSLRMTFGTAAEGVPHLLIAPELTIPLPVLDLTAIAPEEQDAHVRALALQDAQRPFDLSKGPLLRARLLKLDEQTHVLLITLHHIISDGWSTEVLLRELATLYAAYTTGSPSRLPDLAIQYADYARWQRSHLSGETLERELAYWRRQLAGAPALLDLPTDFPRPAVQSFQGARQQIRLSAALRDTLKRLARDEGVTLFMTLLAAFGVLLHRVSQQTDLVIGTPTAGRSRRETEGLIGFFANALPLRLDLAGDPSFAALLGRVRETCLGAYAHQEVPFERVVEALRPQRSLSYTPLFQVVFVLHHAPSDSIELPGLHLEQIDVPSDAAKFDLTIDLMDSPLGLSGMIEYNTALFRDSTIRRMTQHFETLLHGLETHQDTPISRLPLLTPGEREQLAQWTATRIPFLDELHVYQQIEEQAARSPNAVAVSFKRESLTYAQLDARASRLAQELKRKGVGPEVLVGICVERSLDLVVAPLAVWKAGGAYVPLDPAYPRERLAFMATDARLALMLTQRALTEQLPALPVPQLLLEDLLGDDLVPESPAGPATERPRDHGTAVSGHNLAYVIYTSGSTGTPKGVQITHTALSNFMMAMRRRLDVQMDDILCAVTSLSFDIAALELFLPLLVGAHVEIAARDVVMDGSQLAGQLADSRVTMMQATPATWRMLLDQQWGGIPGLTALCGGEALPADMAVRLDALGLRLWNMYGPTETTIWSTMEPVTEGFDPVPIGRPIANTQVYVLDSRLELCPVGVPGDLYIGGYGLARGYLGRPDLTAERFIPDPFGPVSGSRLYQTGDRARWHEAGVLEYLGRRDLQIKLRGYRIELGEIEAALRRHPTVKDAVVLAREDVPGQKRLVAYIQWIQVPAPLDAPSSADTQVDGLDESPTTLRNGDSQLLAEGLRDELRRYLTEWLPQHQIPAVYISVTRWPLTANGKLDRSGLPAPERGHVWAADGGSFADGGDPGDPGDPGDVAVTVHELAPQTPVEVLLAEIWSSVLCLSPERSVGRYDNFFELGGDSILSLQVVARARQAGIACTTKQLFQHQTIAELASVLEQRDIAASATVSDSELPGGQMPEPPPNIGLTEQQVSKALERLRVKRKPPS